MMFKRIQLNQSRRMILDVNVIEDVRRELEANQNVRDRPVIDVVRSLDNKSLEELAVFLRLTGRCRWIKYIFSIIH
jgi:hypothetical protein